MRLHRLELTAFGPFADHQEVDFDLLSQAGLFLLHGPTGAGKSSVLDAICFALYGRVPGVRGSAGRLRSDHAPAHVGPEVVCDFSVSGRRFEVTRSPEWQRPKKRGTGTVAERAHVVVRERVGTEWTALTNRVDEAADLLQQVIGLGAEQFTKLILLPQGDFAAFLRATAEERRPLLQKLFGTDRFAEVERWLADRRREYEHQMHAANTTTARLFARAQEARLAVSVEIKPGQINSVEIDPVPSVEFAVPLVSGWAQEARTELRQAHRAVGMAEKAYESARQAAESAAEQQERRHRESAWAGELRALTAVATEQERRRSALAAAVPALVLAPLLTELDDAQRQLPMVSRRLAAAEKNVRAAGEDPAAVTTERVTNLREQLGSLAELLDAERDLARLEARHLVAERQIETAETDVADADRLLTELRSRRAELDSARSAAELIAVTRPDREQDAARATAIAKAVLEQQHLAVRQAELKDALRAAIDVHQARVAASQELRARRLDGMAAELAAGLSETEPCPVCGSSEHPAPAAHTTPAVTELAQQRAEQAEQSAEAARELAQGEVNAAAEQWAALLAITGGADAETAAMALAEADRRVVEARTAVTTAGRLVSELDAIDGRLAAARERQVAAVSLAATGRESLAEIDARRSDLRARLDRGRGEDADVRTRQRRLTSAAQDLAEYLSARTAVEEATERHDRALAAADHAAEVAGFPDRRSAQAAVLPETHRRRFEAELAEHDTQVARLKALLEESQAVPGSEEAQMSLLEPTDLDQLRVVQSKARLTHEQARERHTLATRAVRALTGLAAELDQHAVATEPLRQRFAALDSVSRCVEGTGGDNTLRMRLSSYVLAARLEQVADAASIRLSAMSGGRYLLVHTDGPSRSGARSGLGLAVVDGWTGVQRDPASLSGGETFCTSLALALGLADVVQAEAGGSVIETLLVDEGFGSLDEQTLDEVMDVLDGLRSAGRSVGLVSHVGDLRDRIPAQLRVHKTRTGSQLIA